MKKSTLLLALVSGLALAAAPALAVPDPSDLCTNVCAPGVACDEPCRVGFNQWTTCGQYNGAPANDLDSDGVANSSDNCTCAPNANQANCDGDAFGNACDTTDNSWYFVSRGSHACEMDVDTHFGYQTMEVFYADTYRSNCTGASCIKKTMVEDFNCFPTATMSCCTSNWTYSDCGGAWNQDNCGFPRCSF